MMFSRVNDFIGVKAQDEIVERLSNSEEPVKDLMAIQHSIIDSSGMPSSSLKLLDLFSNTKRSEVFRVYSIYLKEVLIDRLNPDIDKEILDKMLLDSYKYIDYPELRPVALKLLDLHPKIPLEIARYFEENDKAYFSLPKSVKTKLWVSIPQMISKELSGYVDEYIRDFLHQCIGSLYDMVNTLSCKIRLKRYRGTAIQNFESLIGDDSDLYFKVIEYIQCRYGESTPSDLLATEEPGLLILHSDLILHPAFQKFYAPSSPLKNFCSMLEIKFESMNENTDGFIVNNNNNNNALIDWIDIQRIVKCFKPLGKDICDWFDMKTLESHNTTPVRKMSLKKPNEVLKESHLTLRAAIEKVMKFIAMEDERNVFKHPVTDDIAPGYSSVIETPISMTEIREYYHAKKYKDFSQFEADIHLMFRNCSTFNPPKTFYDKYGKKLHNKVKQKLKRYKTRLQIPVAPSSETKLSSSPATTTTITSVSNNNNNSDNNNNNNNNNNNGNISTISATEDPRKPIDIDVPQYSSYVMILGDPQTFHILLTQSFLIMKTFDHAESNTNELLDNKCMMYLLKLLDIGLHSKSVLQRLKTQQDDTNDLMTLSDYLPSRHKCNKYLLEMLNAMCSAEIRDQNENDVPDPLTDSVIETYKTNILARALFHLITLDRIQNSDWIGLRPLLDVVKQFDADRLVLEHAPFIYSIISTLVQQNDKKKTEEIRNLFNFVGRIMNSLFYPLIKQVKHEHGQIVLHQSILRILKSFKDDLPDEDLKEMMKIVVEIWSKTHGEDSSTSRRSRGSSVSIVLVEVYNSVLKLFPDMRPFLQTNGLLSSPRSSPNVSSTDSIEPGTAVIGDLESTIRAESSSDDLLHLSKNDVSLEMSTTTTVGVSKKHPRNNPQSVKYDQYGDSNPLKRRKLGKGG